MLFALLKSLARVRHFSSYAYFLMIFLSLADEIPNTSADSQSLTLSEKKMQNGKQNKYNAQTMTNTSMQKLWEIFHLLVRHQRRRMSNTAVHPSMEFLMQLSVVGLFLVLLLYLYLVFTTINFLLWLCNLQVLKDLNPNSAGLFCRNVCQLVSSDGLPHPLRRWHRQTAHILDKYFCKVHDSLWKSSCRLSSSPAQTWWPQRSHANSQWREAIQLWTVQLQRGGWGGAPIKLVTRNM